MLILALLFALSILLSLVGVWLLAVSSSARTLAWNWPDWTWARRSAAVAVCLGVLFTPLLIFKAWELQATLRLMSQRMPAPLDASGIEYRQERLSGIGPGAAETGFIVYRLTEESAEWGRNNGAALGEHLSGGSSVWRPTPVGQIGDGDRWHPYDDEGMGYDRPHESTVDEFLGRYGFFISIEDGAEADADRAIQNPGSFYSYGRGGSVTVIDPQRGKVYFAYAG
jgi:hypothetical protein